MPTPPGRALVSIVGTDRNRSRPQPHHLGALMKSAAGDTVVVQLPGGTEYLTVQDAYGRISVEPFR